MVVSWMVTDVWVRVGQTSVFLSVRGISANTPCGFTLAAPWTADGFRQATAAGTCRDGALLLSGSLFLHRHVFT